MSKKLFVTIIKVVSIIIWAVVLFCPMIIGQTQDVNYVNDNASVITENQVIYTVEFDKEVKSGTLEIEFFKDDTSVGKTSVPFDNNKGKSVTVTISSATFADADKFLLLEAEVVTVFAGNVSAIMYPIAIVLAVILVFVLKLNAKEQEVNEKNIEVYSGLFTKQIKVDGELVAQEKGVYLFKPARLTYNLSEDKVYVTEFSAAGKITTYVKDEAINREIEAKIAEEQKANDGDSIDSATEDSPAEETEQVADKGEDIGGDEE